MHGSTARGARIDWHLHADEAAWIGSAVDTIRDALQAALAERRETWLLVSGGATPVPVYRALSEVALDWSRIVVSLVDERDVEPDASGSNAHLVRETLLRERAVSARFRPLRESRQALDAAVAANNARWPERAAIAIAVLGMGEDGHIASLFPGAADLDAAFASEQPYAAIDASGCPAAGNWPHRISLTPVGLQQAHRRLLLIRGARKRAVFERALCPGDANEAPVRAAIDVDGTPLRVDWCA